MKKIERIKTLVIVAKKNVIKTYLLCFLLTFPLTPASFLLSCLNLSDSAQDSMMMNKSM